MLLALAADPMPTGRICSLLGVNKVALHRRKSRLAAEFVPVELSDSGYLLAPSAVSVDARDFIAAVEALPVDAPADVLGRLAAQWRGDPFSRYRQGTVPAGLWAPLLNARNELVRRLAELPEENRPASAAKLAAYFPDDPALAPLLPAALLPKQKRLLVVDDTSSDRIVHLLGTGYKFVVMTDWTEWAPFVEAGGLKGVDGALVDLHLSKSGEGPGHEGIAIINDLCRSTEIPTALISVNPPPDLGDRQGSVFLSRYRLVRLLSKGRDDEHLTSHLGDLAEQLVGAEPRHQLCRLEAWLNYAAYNLEVQAAKEQRPGGRPVARLWSGEHRRAKEAVDQGRLSEAVRLVDAFCRRWTNRPGPRLPL
nr:hypothetical protein [Streptomyces sp. 846.5]